MELLAILSTIILVGTVATLILAVASYILYKARERRSAVANHGPQVRSIAQQHVLTAPAFGYSPRALPQAGQQPFYFAEADGAPAQQQQMGTRPVQAATYVPPQHLQVAAATRPEEWEYGTEAFAPARRNGVHGAAPVRSQDHDLAWLG